MSLDDGTSLRLMFKNFGRDNMLKEARDIKPEFVYDSRREISTYRDILAQHDLGTPVFYGAVLDEDKDRYWLFTEKIEGQELYQIGDFEIWREVARWLASMHKRFSLQAGLLGERVPLLSYKKEFLTIWMRRAEEHFRDSEVNNVGGFGMLAEQYEHVIERITALPTTFLHGEFYPSNILVAGVPGALRICPVDWEMAAIGPGLIDLAALTSGRWTAAQRMSLIMAYVSNGPAEYVSDLETMLRDLEYCRLYLAVQWLGVFGSRQPYWQHRHDWLSEALDLADKMASSKVH